MIKACCSWDEVTDAEIEAFIEDVETLKENRLPIDCDGDFPVNIIVVDRRKYGPLHYDPVPYDHISPSNEVEGALLFNLDIAIDALRVFRDIHRLR